MLWVELTAEEDAQLIIALANPAPDNNLSSITHSHIATADLSDMAPLDITAPFVLTLAECHMALEAPWANVCRNSWQETESHVATSSTSVLSVSGQEPTEPTGSIMSLENPPAYGTSGKETGDIFIINSYNLCPVHITYSAGPHYIIINGVISGYFEDGKYHALRME